MTIIIATLVFILGTAIGSFLSVLVHRLKSKKSIIFSRSICPSCKKKLMWKHMIPIFSWTMLKGKCAYCGKEISYHYLALEITTGITFLLSFIKFNFIEEISGIGNPSLLTYLINWQALESFMFFIIISTLLLAIFFYDLKYQLIPDRLSLPAIGAAIAGGLVIGTPLPIEMVIGGTVIFGFFFLQFALSKGTWLGGGDLRLGALMGILLGWQLGILALGMSYILGAAFALILLIQKKATRKTALPFAPFLVTATILTLLYGDKLLELYKKTFLVI